MRSISFRDFDAFSASVRDVDAVMTLENPERRLWTINQVNIQGIDVQLGLVGSGNLIEGQSWQNGTLIYFPLSPRVAYRANGIALDKNEFMVLEPGCEFCLSTKFAHDWCSVFLPTGFVRGDDPLGPSSASPVSEMARCRVAPANRQLMARFNYVVNQVMMASANSSDFENSPAAKSAAVELKEVASLVLREVQTIKSDRLGRPATSRTRIIHSCKDLIEARAGTLVRVEELAAKAGVSERTLRQVFYDYFGIGPLRYLQLRQLHQVKRALNEADPEAIRVSNVLTKHGVWEFGRFASRYRRLFGELPSQTLRAPLS
jgi:AraC family ethanolamine operon transcriptional activator